jgi:hypothetical protein
VKIETFAKQDWQATGRLKPLKGTLGWKKDLSGFSFDAFRFCRSNPSCKSSKMGHGYKRELVR